MSDQEKDIKKAVTQFLQTHSVQLKKWHDDAEREDYLRALFTIVQPDKMAILSDEKKYEEAQRKAHVTNDHKDTTHYQEFVDLMKRWETEGVCDAEALRAYLQNMATNSSYYSRKLEQPPVVSTHPNSKREDVQLCEAYVNREMHAGDVNRFSHWDMLAQGLSELMQLAGLDARIQQAEFVRMPGKQR